MHNPCYEFIPQTICMIGGLPVPDAAFTKTIADIKPNQDE
jgi:hypothetical protein